jgi:IS1 family transposase
MDCVDRGTNKVIDFEVGDRTKQTYLKLAFRLEKEYKIEHLCTDIIALINITQYLNLIIQRKLKHR